MPDVILISGEEEFLAERAALDEAESRLSSSVLWFSQDEISRYEEEIDTPPIDGSRRLFVVRAQEMPRLPSEPDGLIVISRKKLDFKGAKRSYEFPKLKAFDDRNEYVSWIIKEGERLNIDLSRVAVGLFVNSRRSLRKISSEIRKLSSFVSGVVTPDDLRAVLCFSAEVAPKDVLDAMCDGRPDKALTYLDILQEAGDETGWTIAYMQRHVLQQLRMERLHADGLPPSDVAARLGVHPFFYRKSLAPRLGLWTRESLLRSLDELCSLDVLHKTGNPAAPIGLEAEVIRLSEEARDVCTRYRN